MSNLRSKLAKGSKLRDLPHVAPHSAAASANATIGVLPGQINRCTAAPPSTNQCAAAAIFASIFFFAAGQPFVPLLGLQNDEALFAGPIYEPLTALYSWHLGHKQIPLMLLSYLGCVKTLIYYPVFKLFGTGIYAVREPALVSGAAGIWLFYLLLRRIAGYRAALIGCWLLAADSLYLLTTCYDWGPVAIEHLLIVAGSLSLVRFCQSQSPAALFSGFFLFGLALWDKALAVWILSGLAVAAICVYPRRSLAIVTRRRVLLSALAAALGALPLISYNLHARFSTIRENTVNDRGDLISKAYVLLGTARGDALIDFWTAPAESTPAPHQPRGRIQSLAAGISSFAGHPSSDFLLAGVIAAVALAPLGGWATIRAVLFFLIAMSVAWLEMATNRHTGNTVHHTILLWPWPEAIIAISFAAASQHLGRFGAPAAAAATALIAISSLLVTNEYYSRLVRYGGSPAWNAAIFPLARSLRGMTASHVFCTDWGYLDALILLDRNRPVMRSAIDMPADAAAMAWALGDSSNLFVNHAKNAEVYAGAGEKFIQAAARFGRRPQPVATITDGYGREAFIVYRFQ